MPFVFPPAEPVTKARGPGARWVNRLARKVRRNFQQPLVRELIALRSKVPPLKLAEAVLAQNQDHVFELALVDRVGGIVVSFDGLWREALEEGGRLAAREVDVHEPVTFEPQIVRKVIDPSERWVLRVLTWMEGHSAQLVRQVNGTSRRAVQAMLVDGFRRGRHPRSIAKDIKQVVGLTEPQAVAVARRRQAMLEAGVPEKRIEVVTNRYAEKLLKQRAETIAHHETMTAINRGRYETWAQLEEEGALEPGVQREWLTSGDEGVCSICGPMHGQKVGMRESYELGNGGRVAHPPAHVGCLPSGVLVGNGSVRAATRRWYEGELVHLETLLGPRLSVTPNHPILTRRGMIAAKLIKHGDDVLCAGNRQRESSLVNPDGEALPSCVEEVFDALRFSPAMVRCGVPASPVQFHGDGFSNGHVDIVAPASLFKDAQDAGLLQPAGETNGRRPRVFPPVARTAASLLLALFLRWGAAPGCHMRRNHLRGPLLRRHLRPLEKLCLAAATGLYAHFNQARPDGASRHTEVLSDGLFGHAPQVELAQLIERDLEPPVLLPPPDRFAELSTFLVGSIDGPNLQGLNSRPKRDAVPRETVNDDPATKAGLGTNLRNRPPHQVLGADLFRRLSLQGFKTLSISHVGVSSFRGYVYNLETNTGWYTGHGIVTSNCRCTEALT